MNNPLQNLPPIYWINLKNATKRRSMMESFFQKYQITKQTRINAWNGHQPELIKPYLKCDYVKKLTEYATTMSHLDALRTFVYTSTEPYAIIMEDDVSDVFLPHLSYQWDDIQKQIPEDASIVQLSIITPEPIFTLSKRKYNYWGTSAYWITREYATKLIEMFHYFEDVFDFSMVLGDNALADVLIYNECWADKVYCIHYFTTTYEDSQIHAKNLPVYRRYQLGLLEILRKNCGIKKW